MHINQAKFKRFSINQELGFSLIEVLVAFSILVIILMIVLESRLNSVRRIEKTGSLNQVQDRVRNDLASIRKQALMWKCQPGTACSGLLSHRNNPPRYIDLIPPENVDPVDPDSAEHYCNKENPLAEFQESIPDMVNLDNENIIITRTLSINSVNKKQLDITYDGKIGDRSISSNASIIPQAMNWCR